MKNILRVGLCAVSIATLVACQAPGGPGGAQDGYAQSCLKGAGLGALGGVIYDVVTNKGSTQSTKSRVADVGKAVAAGCVIGIATTAIGKLLNQGQQQRYEEALQRDARRRATEQERYNTARARTQAQPASTPQQIASRDAELARLQKEYEASVAQPSQVDLGSGATATVTNKPVVTTGELAGCQPKVVLVQTPAGQARQEELFCPVNGQMTRVDVKPA